MLVQPVCLVCLCGFRFDSGISDLTQISVEKKERRIKPLSGEFKPKLEETVMKLAAEGTKILKSLAPNTVKVG